MAACACFVLLLNTSPAFAQAVDGVPVLGPLARIFTVREFHVDDRDHLIDVRLPALENTGHTDLEQRVNREIQTRIDAVLDEAEQRAREARDAYVATGGEEEDFIPIIISVDYDIKCQNEQNLSFVLTKTELTVLNERLRTLQLKNGMSVPKGVDPMHPQRVSRRAMRGR